MNNIQLQPEAAQIPAYSPYLHSLFEKAEHIISQHRLENPDLYRIIEEQKIIAANDTPQSNFKSLPFTSSTNNKPKLAESIYFKKINNPS